jgi:hypothetical protein
MKIHLLLENGKLKMKDYILEAGSATRSNLYRLVKYE